MNNKTIKIFRISIISLSLSISLLVTLLMVIESSNRKQIDILSHQVSLKRQVDSLRDEIYVSDIQTARYEVAIEKLKERYPGCWAKYDSTLALETE